MACISGADAGVRVVAVGGPCTPVVSEDVSSLEGRLRSRPRRAEAAGRAGLVINGLFRAGRAGFQILRFRNFRRKIVRQKLAVFAAAGLADSSVLAVSCAAGAIVRLRVACISGADAGVRAGTVGRPRAVVVAENVAGCEGGFIGCALGAQTADGAGFVVDCFFCTVGAGFQVLLLCRFCREVVGQLFAVLGIAGTTLCLGGTGGRAAGTSIGFGGVAVLTLACPRVRTVAIGRPTPQMAQRRARLLIQMVVVIFDQIAGAHPVVQRVMRTVCG